MTDYSQLIDAETWAFINETASCYPPETANMGVEDQRRIYDEMCQVFFQGYPDGIEAHDSDADGVPVRIYETGPARKAAPATVMYFHGGGFVVGGLESHDDVCAEIAARTGFRVVSVDYRLAPEFRHPAHFDDAVTATDWAQARYTGSIVLSGDSAGGNLAASVAHGMRGQGIAGQVLIYPGLGSDMSTGSYITHAKAPMLTRAEIEFYGSVRFEGGVIPSDDPTSMPLQDKDFSGLPPTYVVSAECDPICDDGQIYVDAIKAAGGQAQWVKEKGLVHGYLRARTTVTRARDSFERVVGAILAMGQGNWAPDD